MLSLWQWQEINLKITELSPSEKKKIFVIVSGFVDGFLLGLKEGSINESMNYYESFCGDSREI